jgi:hypothetical protein
MANGSLRSIVKAIFNIGLAQQVRLSDINWYGPSSYTQVTAGTPPALATGGDQISAAAFGLKTIEDMVGGISWDGTYEAIPYRISLTVWGLYWRVLSTGAQVAGAVDLSTSTVRLSAKGQ